MQEPKNARKTYIYVFRGLRVKARVTNLQKHPTNFFPSLLDSWLPSVPKWSPLKAFSLVLLVLLTQWTRSSVSNLWKNAGNFAVLVFYTAKTPDMVKTCAKKFFVNVKLFVHKFSRDYQSLHLVFKITFRKHNLGYRLFFH